MFLFKKAEGESVEYNHVMGVKLFHSNTPTHETEISALPTHRFGVAISKEYQNRENVSTSLLPESVP